MQHLSFVYYVNAERAAFCVADIKAHVYITELPLCCWHEHHIKASSALVGGVHETSRCRFSAS